MIKKFLLITSLIISGHAWTQPLTFLEIEEEGFLIVSEDSNEILMVDHSNLKWLRGIIYSGIPIEMSYGSGLCMKEFSHDQYQYLEKPNDLKLELQTKLTTHYAKIHSGQLKKAIKSYVKRNEDFQINFTDGKYWSCFEFTKLLDDDSLYELAESQPSTFCKLLEDEPYWKKRFKKNNITCDKNLNLDRESFNLVLDRANSIKPIFKPSVNLKENYKGLHQCKALYSEIQLREFISCGFNPPADDLEKFRNSKKYLNCPIHQKEPNRIIESYISKFRIKSEELESSQGFSKEDLRNFPEFERRLSRQVDELIIALAKNADNPEMSQLPISRFLKTCMDYRDYVDGNLKVEIDIENKEQQEELDKKEFEELSLNDKAMMYILGERVEQDLGEAFRLFSISAEEGSQYAQSNLGLMYSDGTGVRQDHKKAVYWFRKAAEQGNASAQTSLGFAYEKGKGVEKNLEEAIKFYRLSADQGNWMAQRNLGYLYLKGKGVSLDKVYALMWFSLAGTAGDDVAYSEAQSLLKVLDKSEIKEAYELARDCYDNYLKGCYVR